MARSNKTRRGFSLIELVIVVVIIGIIAAIAIPRMSRGSAGAADTAMSGNLNVLRSAVDLYATEHNGDYPDDPENQLVKFTNAAGLTSATKTGAFIYGPYVRKVPAVTVGPLKGIAAGAQIDVGTTDTVSAAPTKGWLYNKTNGTVKANIAAGEADASGKDYNTY